MPSAATARAAQGGSLAAAGMFASPTPGFRALLTSPTGPGATPERDGALLAPATFPGAALASPTPFSGAEVLSVTPAKRTGWRESFGTAGVRRDSTGTAGGRRDSTGTVGGTPLKAKAAWCAAHPARVLGVGSGGVEELAQQLDNGMVSWALLRFQVGGGTFARVKCVAVHCNGQDTPVILRGQLNSRGQEVLMDLGDVHANVEVVCAEDLTVEYLCERLLPLFATDDMSYSLQALRAEYGKSVAEMQEFIRQQQEEARRQEEEARAREAREAALAAEAAEAEMCEYAVMPTWEEALQAVGSDRDSYNWALLEPTQLALFRAGYGGLEEMRAWLPADRVLFGLLRLSFGGGEGEGGGATRTHADITKHVFVHWVGPAVGAIKRGRWNAQLQDASRVISSRAAVAFKREAHDLKSLDLEELMSEVRRVTVIDRRAATSRTVAAARICAEEYAKALAEEGRRRAAAEALAGEAKRRAAEAARPEPSPEEAAAAEPPPLPDLRSAVEAVGTRSGKWNWVLVGWPREAAAAAAAAAAAPTPLRASSARALPSPCRKRRSSVVKRLSAREPPLAEDGDQQ